MQSIDPVVIRFCSLPEQKSVDIAVVRFRLVLVLGQLGQKNELFECLHCPKWHATVCWSRCTSVQCDVGKFPRSWEAFGGHTRSCVRPSNFFRVCSGRRAGVFKYLHYLKWHVKSAAIATHGTSTAFAIQNLWRYPQRWLCIPTRNWRWPSFIF